MIDVIRTRAGASGKGFIDSIDCCNGEKRFAWMTWVDGLFRWNLSFEIRSDDGSDDDGSSDDVDNDNDDDDSNGGFEKIDKVKSKTWMVD